MIAITMKRLFLSLPMLLIMVLTSCSEKEDPTPEAAAPERLAAISGDNQTVEFFYDNFGNVTRWTHNCDGDRTQANYNYSISGAIILRTLRTYKSDPVYKTLHDETMYLNGDGLAEYTEGTYILYHDMKPETKKRFHTDFIYNDLGQLITIRFSEWRQDGDGWEDTPWTWENSLEWEAGNIVRYTDYLGNSKPFNEYQYTYYGGITVTVNPVVFPIIRPEYTPLQLAGYLGRQSREQVKEVTITEMSGNTQIEKYSYDFSSSLIDTRIESFTKTVNDGVENAFSVLWR